MQRQFDHKESAIYFEKVSLLTEEATYKLDEVIEALGLRRFNKQGKMLVGACPVHGGDRPNAFNLYPDGHTTRCNWVCRSRGCQNVFRGNLFGFIRGVLSNQELGFSGENEKSKIYSYGSTVKWLEKFLAKKMGEFKVSYEEIEKKKFIKQVESLQRNPFKEPDGLNIESVCSKLIIPSPYFINRGFSSEVLTKFKVGEPKSPRPNLPMSGRAIAPVLDETGSRVIGFTGRSLFDKCEKCNLWHDPLSCKSSTLENSSKWKNNFKKENYLYGYWLSKPEIEKTKSIYIVESPGNLWRLYEAGIRNGVALMGTQLSDRCQVIIERSGAEKAHVIMDGDEAGEGACVDIEKRLKNWLKLRFLKIPKQFKDVGEMEVGALRQLIGV